MNVAGVGNDWHLEADAYLPGFMATDRHQHQQTRSVAGDARLRQHQYPGDISVTISNNNDSQAASPGASSSPPIRSAPATAAGGRHR